MKDVLMSYLTFGNRFYGLEQAQVNNQTIYYGIELKKTKNQVEVENSFQCNELSELSNFIPKDKPIFLVVNNEFIITKKIESNQVETLEILHLAFPNIKTYDFYYEILKQDNTHFVSICRKTHLDKLLENCTSNKLSIIDFSLGSLIITSISNLIPQNDIHTANRHISKVNGQIKNIELLENLANTSYSFNDTELKNTELLAFSAALSLISKNQQLDSSFETTQINLLTNYKEKRFFKQFLKIGLTCLFILLLGNFFLFNNYYNKVNQLRETSQVLTTSKNKVISLSDKVQKTQKMVEDVLKGNASKSSFYVDAVINSVPDAIILSKLNYQPLLKKIKADKVIENDTDIILISGTSSQNILVSNWISELESIDWIKQVEILSFEDNSKSSSLFSFKIHILK
ncbi:PilN domain-containing protein [Psychroserpens algicola]|uniref:General secretion pathway protein L n=1 Tax=Psychroserpens algicola TaxID=1719034 RepID=A0ABT0H4U5_9FLAO|nr:PilN domain-containing protein [Psychroserpens algicola]MCK8479019.1 hypothetical protein [Psychroserpens algicola]